MRIVFMGSPPFAATSLAALLDAGHEVALVVSQPDKRAGRGKKLVSPAVVELAVDRGLEVVQPRSARRGLAEILRETGAAIGVVVAYGKILPREVLEAFEHGCVNVHASILPAYRGAAPIQHAVINGETETGVSIMRLDEGMDTGPVLKIARAAIGELDTAGAMFGKLAPLGAETLVATLAEIEAGTAVETPQDDERATYAPMLAKSDGYIDWSQPGDAVRNRVRGVDPWPTASATWGDMRIKLWSAYPPNVGEVGQGAPGEVLSIDERGAVIACGSGACGVGEIQAPGRKRMDALSFARGRGLEVGARLGQIEDPA